MASVADRLADLVRTAVAVTCQCGYAPGTEVRPGRPMAAEHWINTLDSRFDEFVALQGEEVAGVWRLYLAGGRLAFEQGRMGVDQIVAVKPGR